ncbi:class I SAM-dependent methyltransferase [Gemmatimonadota bacterium]
MRDWRKYWSSSAQYDNEIEADGYSEQGRVLTLEQIDTVRKDIGAKLEIKPSDRVLEVGCGVGLQLDYLSRTTNDLFGIDYAPGMIFKAKKRLAGSYFSLSEAAHLPFARQSFDKVFSYSVFHYLPSQVYAGNVVSSMIEVCKKGGIVLVGDLMDQKRKDDYLKYLGEYTINLTLPELVRLRLSQAKKLLLGQKENEDLDELFFNRGFFPDLVKNRFPDCRVEEVDQENVDRITAKRKLRYDLIIRL